MINLILILLVLVGSYSLIVIVVKRFHSLNTYEESISYTNQYINKLVTSMLKDLGILTVPIKMIYPTLPSTYDTFGNLVLDKSVLLSRLDFLKEYFESTVFINYLNSANNNVWILYIKVAFPKGKYKDNTDVLRHIIRTKLEQVYSELPEMNGIPIDNLFYICQLPENSNEFILKIGISYSQDGDAYISKYKAIEEEKKHESVLNKKDINLTEDIDDETLL